MLMVILTVMGNTNGIVGIHIQGLLKMDRRMEKGNGRKEWKKDR
jgi:heme/copper-type cytochrome/quinol oxidase subunit 1